MNKISFFLMINLILINVINSYEALGNEIVIHEKADKKILTKKVEFIYLENASINEAIKIIQYLYDIKINFEYYNDVTKPLISFKNDNIALKDTLNYLIKNLSKYQIVLDSNNSININPIQSNHCGYYLFRKDIPEFIYKNIDYYKLKNILFLLYHKLEKEIYNNYYKNNKCDIGSKILIDYSGIEPIYDNIINIHLKNTCLKEIAEEIVNKFPVSYRYGVEGLNFVPAHAKVIYTDKQKCKYKIYYYVK